MNEEEYKGGLSDGLPRNCHATEPLLNFSSLDILLYSSLRIAGSEAKRGLSRSIMVHDYQDFQRDSYHFVRAFNVKSRNLGTR